jgi:folylpolyglutamate synthase/dihydropteroate synthase
MKQIFFNRMTSASSKWASDGLWLLLKRKVDIAIIEVGMGGRLDATNIISVITNIGLDHTQFLETPLKL